MNSQTRVRRFLIPLVLAGASIVAEARLDLFTTIDGVQYRIAGTSNGQVVISADGKKRTVPRNATWQLTGGISDNAQFFDLSPDQSFLRSSDSIIKKDPDAFGRIQVTVHSPSPDTADAYAVAMVWLEGNEASRVLVEPDALQGNGDSGVVTFELLLNETEMAGKPVVLLWKDGDFVPAETRFENEETEDAFRATIFNDVEKLRSTIDEKAKVNATEPGDKWTLAHYAAEAGSTEALKVLLGESSRLALAKSKKSHTPLEVAASNGRLDCLALLIDGISNKSALKKAASEALSRTISKGQVDSLRMLLNAGAGPGGDPRSERVFIATAISSDSPAICDMLLEAGVEVDFKSSDLAEMLSYEAEAGHADIVRWMIEHGVKPDLDDPDRSILIKVARTAPGELAAVLLDAGADPDGANSNGLTALITAASSANLDYARVLCEAGADVNAATNSGTTALHAAAIGNSSEIIEMLLERGADPNSRDSNFWTPLDVALVSAAREAATVLAANGSEVSVGSTISDVVMEQAIKFDLASVVSSALEQGWPANSNFAGVWPAIRLANIFGSESCAEVLRDAGAEVVDEVPTPVVGPRELDETLKVTRAISPRDPRPLGTVHPTETVVVEFLLDAEGRPQFPIIRKSDNPTLSPEALKVIGDWRFNPPRKDGAEVATRVAVPILFRRVDKRWFELGELTKVPVPISQVDPVHPLELLRQRITGSATIEFVVLADGTVTNARPIAYTHPLFGIAATRAISAWRFQPGELRGRPVNVRVRQQIVFSF